MVLAMPGFDFARNARCEDAVTVMPMAPPTSYRLKQLQPYIMRQDEHQHADQDVAWITAQSKAHWDRSSTSYAEILIRRGLTEPNCRQVIDAVIKHCNPGV